jgi:6-phosphogluconolactonase
MAPETIETASEKDFVERGVSLLRDEIADAIKQRGRAIVGLSGGSTPRPIYEILGKEKLDWSRVYIFLVDERSIAKDHPDSNQFLLRSTLLRHAPTPESHLFFPDTSLSLNECVARYDEELRTLLRDDGADIVTLGLGEDGHTASLFPPLGEEAFGRNFAIHTTTDRFAVRDRISVTLRVLQEARHTVFFLSGAAKQTVWEEMLRSSEDFTRWPGQAALVSGRSVAITQW